MHSPGMENGPKLCVVAKITQAVGSRYNRNVDPVMRRNLLSKLNA